MKKYIYILILAAGALFQSCDLDTEATSAAPVEIVFDDVRSAQFAINGTWSYLMDTYYSYQNPGFSSVLLASDAMGSDVAMQSGKYGYYRHYSFVEMANEKSTPVVGIWQIIYRSINNTNLIIDKIDVVPANPNADPVVEEALRQHIKGQAYALRGYLYFYLATFYGDAYQYKSDSKCVPIYTKPTGLDTKGNPKSTVAEVYSRAEEDLKTAHTLLKGFERSKKHFVNEQVAAGILARLYNQRMNGEADWSAALKYAAEAQNGSSWMPKVLYLVGFNDRANDEWIWGHGQTTDQNVASYSFSFKDVKTEMSGYYSFMADPYFIDLFTDKKGVIDAGDVRTELFEWDKSRFKGGLMYKKFLYKVDETADIVLMRKAEMVLVEAESLAELSRLPEAVAKLNELRKERGAILLDASTITDKKTLIDIIMIERRKELFGEGFGLSDIKRRQNTIVRKEVADKTPIPNYVPAEGGTPIYKQGHTIYKFPDGTAFVANSPYYNFLIPAIERTNNPNLEK